MQDMKPVNIMIVLEGFLQMDSLKCSISDPHLLGKISSLVEEAQINLVIPSFDETLGLVSGCSPNKYAISDTSTCLQRM